MKNLWEKITSLSILFVAFLIIHLIFLSFFDIELLSLVLISAITLSLLLLIYFNNNWLSNHVSEKINSKRIKFFIIVFVFAFLLWWLMILWMEYNTFNTLLNRLVDDDITLQKIIDVNLINLTLVFISQLMFYIVVFIFWDKKHYSGEKSSFKENSIMLIIFSVILTLIFLSQ